VLPIVHGLEKEYAGRIEFIRVNILNERSRPLMERFSFSLTPELYLVDERGRVIGFWDTVEEADVLRQAFDRALEQQTSPQ
jgi:hypothetical protein